MNEIGIDLTRARRLGAFLDDEVAAGRLPGAVVQVFLRGRGALSHCTGLLDPARKDGMRADTIFRIFSMTKPIVSMAALMLMEEGRIELSEPVAKYLPAFRPTHACAPLPASSRERDELVPLERPVTVYDLLTHTSGLIYAERGAPPAVLAAQRDAGLAVCPRHISAVDFLAGLSACPLAFQPGRCWGYGYSTDVLGLLVAEVSGERLSDHLHRRIFGPLGMSDTSFEIGAEQRHRVAEPYREVKPASDAAISGSRDIYEPVEPAAMDSGGAGALSTASDYLRFARLLLGNGTLDGVTLLSPSSVRLMTSNHLSGRIAVPLSPGEASFGSPGYGFGLGVGVRLEHGCASVPGSPGDYYWGGAAGTFFWVDPLQDLAVVYLAQTPGAIRQRYRRVVRQLVYQALTS